MSHTNMSFLPYVTAKIYDKIGHEKLLIFKVNMNYYVNKIYIIFLNIFKVLFHT